ncbi:MAG: leucine-rich repeat domain-containing protein [Muribaculaceae bacterium]|nr:leucine-rich repeat domain-containing protein [Muribaculaceae bacterium]
MRTFKIRGACTAKLPNIARILAAVIFLIAAGLPASAIDYATIGYIKYQINDVTMEATVLGPSDQAIISHVSIDIPDAIPYNGTLYPVTSVKAYAFRGYRELSGLTIGENVKKIGDYAFDGCSGLKGSLIIPDNVTYIGPRAFMKGSGFTGS